MIIQGKMYSCANEKNIPVCTDSLVSIIYGKFHNCTDRETDGHTDGWIERERECVESFFIHGFISFTATNISVNK